MWRRPSPNRRPQAHQRRADSRRHGLVEFIDIAFANARFHATGPVLPTRGNCLIPDHPSAGVRQRHAAQPTPTPTVERTPRMTSNSHRPSASSR